ncbi:hypothetical protein VTJ04DRAFT_5516 [Mycothermus thermophilus]|uniref:uncharacterized protein n=1 Tax=Humicola insolens TaxID=85995 RepID=UPI00374345C9
MPENRVKSLGHGTANGEMTKSWTRLLQTGTSIRNQRLGEMQDAWCLDWPASAHVSETRRQKRTTHRPTEERRKCAAAVAAVAAVSAPRSPGTLPPFQGWCSDRARLTRTEIDRPPSPSAQLAGGSASGEFPETPPPHEASNKQLPVRA